MMRQREPTSRPLALPALVAGGIATGFHRLFLALPLLWLWMRLEERTAKRGAEPKWLPLAVPGILFAGDIFFWHWSITYTTVANATLFANLAPVIVTFGAWVYLGEHISLRFLLGLGLAMGGAALLVSSSVTLGTRFVFGDGFGLITACFFGGYVVAVARLRDRYAASTIMFYSSAVTCVLLLAATLVSGEGLLPESANGWLALLAHRLGQPGDGPGPHRLCARPPAGLVLGAGHPDRAAHRRDPGLGLARRGVGAAGRRDRACRNPRRTWGERARA
jgi:drug/metabolite transporter (DMT)-like permease